MKEKVENPQLAFENIEFMNSDAARTLRLQAEYLQPNLVMKANHIDHTVVVFGSARTLPPELARKEFKEAEKALEVNPNGLEFKRKLKHARRMLEQSKYYQMAHDFSKLVSESVNRGEHNTYIVTGGGPGIMQAGNQGAHDTGCPSVALNIHLPFEQNPNPYVTEKLCFNFRYFSIRKMHFLTRARALCAFPGGFGTIDELFEALTLIQTEKVPKVPVVIFGKEFWEGLINWDKFVEAGLISEEDLELFHYSDDPEEAWSYIQNFWKEKGKCNELKFI